MSEEPEVSPLRLKRPGAGGPPPTPPPAAPAPDSPPPHPEAPLAPLPGMPMPQSAAPSGDATAPERARRRPSLASDGAAAPAPAPAFIPPLAPEAVIPPPPPAAKDLAPGQAPAPAFKLKVGSRPVPPLPPLPGVPAASSSTMPDTLEEGAGGAPLLPLPGLTPGGAPAGGIAPFPPLRPLPAAPLSDQASAESAQPGLRSPIHLRAEGPAEALDPAKLPPALPARAAKAAVGRAHARRDALVFGLLFILVAGAGVGAYFYFTKPGAAQEGDGIREKLSQAAQLPGKAVNDAKNALTEARGKEQARVDAVNEGKETPADRAVGNVAPAELASKLQEKNAALPAAPAPPPGTPAPAAPTPPTQSVTAYAGEKADTPFPAAAPQASVRFLRYAEGIRVSGVFQGSPARALVDGRLIREGDLLEPMLGIKFADLDPEAKQIILEDATGAQVRVKY